MKTAATSIYFPRRAFTLLEIMMVVAIMGLVMAMAVPAIISARREAPLAKAINDTLEICSRARADAILHNETATVTFHPKTKEISTSAGFDSSRPSTRLGVNPVTSVQFDPSVGIADLSINLDDYGASDVAIVRFFPNGTSDELSFTLSAAGEFRRITLEPTTALAHVDTIQ